jgi:hypothetical protein
VDGTLAVGEQKLALSGPGQRDHSWGPRDWWSAEWMWSAGRLDDGTRFHAVVFRLPDTPPIGVGYLQPPDGGVTEPDNVAASEEVGRDGLITTARISLDDLQLEVEPLAFGPLLLERPTAASPSSLARCARSAIAMAAAASPRSSGTAIGRSPE